MTKASPLNVTLEAQHRIFVGLGWDPNESPTLIDKVGALIGTREAHHDLDLACYFFNKDKACLGFVNADSMYATNPSGSIYHSGDSVEGVGDGDDEQISVELKNLPRNIEHLVFKASIKSGHSFNEIAMPEMRLCDGYTERVFLQAKLENGGQNDAYIFTHISRGKNDGEWFYNHLDIYAKNTDAESWKEMLTRFL